MIEPHPHHPAAMHDHIRWTTSYMATHLGMVDDAVFHVLDQPTAWVQSRTSIIEKATGFAVPTGTNPEQPDVIDGPPHFWYSPTVVALTASGLPWSPDRDARYVIVVGDNRDIAFADNYVRLVVDLLIGSVIAARHHPDAGRAAWLAMAEADLSTRVTDATALLSAVQLPALDRYLASQETP